MAIYSTQSVASSGCRGLLVSSVWVFFAILFVCFKPLFTLSLCCLRLVYANISIISTIANNIAYIITLIIIKHLYMPDFKRFLDVNNFTQEAAAAYFNVSQSFISQMATGKRGISTEFMDKVLAGVDSGEIKGVELLRGEVSLSSSNSGDSVSISREAWDVIRLQTASLERKDRQLDRVIDLLEHQILNKKSTARAGTGASAEVG